MSSDLQKLLEYEKFEMPKTIQILGDLSAKRTEKNKDTVYAVSGEEGSGKSTLATLIGIATSQAASLPFSFEKNMIYTNDIRELRKKLVELPHGSPIIPDEAIKFLYKLNWASASQKYLNILYALARKERKVTILPIPRFTDINEFFRNHRVKIWIHIIKEGHAIMFQKDWSPFSFKDPWHVYQNEKVIEKARKKRKFASFSLRDKLRIFRHCRNFVIYFTFPELPTSIYGQYEILSQKKYDELEEMFPIDDKRPKKIPYKNAMAKMIKEFLDKKYDFNKISYITGLPIPEIQKIIGNIENEKKTERIPV